MLAKRSKRKAVDDVAKSVWGGRHGWLVITCKFTPLCHAAVPSLLILHLLRLRSSLSNPFLGPATFGGWPKCSFGFSITSYRKTRANILLTDSDTYPSTLTPPGPAQFIFSKGLGVALCFLSQRYLCVYPCMWMRWSRELSAQAYSSAGDSP